MNWSAPFPCAQALSQRQNRTLALAGVFQATQLTHMTAMGNRHVLGDTAQLSFEHLIKACLNIRADKCPDAVEPLQYFNSLSDLGLGLKTLESCLSEPFQITSSRIPKWRNPKPTMQYAFALLQLQKKVYQNPLYVQRIQSCQQQILKQLSFFGQQWSHHSILANLAQTYVETAGQIQPRIMVRGHAQNLKDTTQTDYIRASLMTGLQMAHLWHTLGGRSWQLILAKPRLLQDLRALARMQYHLTPPSNAF